MGTRRRLAGIVTLGLLISACGSSGDDTTDEPAEPDSGGTVVTSPDGALTLTIPDGAMPAGIEITVEIGSPLDVGEAETIGETYQLGPDGLQFEAPIQIEYRAPSEDQIGAVASIISSGEDQHEWTNNQVTDIVDGILIHTAEIDHFSNFVLVTSKYDTITGVLVPGNAGNIDVGDSFSASATWQFDPDIDTSGWDLTAMVRATRGGGTTSVSPPETTGTALNGTASFTVTCERSGPGEYGVAVAVRGAKLDSTLGHFMVGMFNLIGETHPDFKYQFVWGFGTGRVVCDGSDQIGGESEQDSNDEIPDWGPQSGHTESETFIPFDCNPALVLETARLPDPLTGPIEIEMREGSADFAAGLAEPHTLALRLTTDGPVLAIGGPGGGVGVFGDVTGGPDGPTIEGRGYNTLDGRFEQIFDGISIADGRITLTGTAQLGDDASTPFDLDLVASGPATADLIDTAEDLWDIEPEQIGVDIYVLDRGDSIAVEGIAGTPCTEFEIFVFVEGDGPQRKMVVTDTQGLFVLEGFERPAGEIKMKSVAAYAIHDGKQVAGAFGDKVSPAD
jgi:hypothetical protein